MLDDNNFNTEYYLYYSKKKKKNSLSLSSKIIKNLVEIVIIFFHSSESKVLIIHTFILASTESYRNLLRKNEFITHKVKGELRTRNDQSPFISRDYLNSRS